MAEATTPDTHVPARLRVLVADDDPLARDELARAVRAAGHDCVVAEDGEQAWRVLSGAGADVVLSDWTLAKLSGIELCQRMRALDGHPYTYFVFVTSLHDKRHFLEGMGAGADEYLEKPVDPEELHVRLMSAERVLRKIGDLDASNRALKRDSERFFSDARIDGLTGIANRRRLDEDLATACARDQRYGQCFSVVMIDVDHFKLHNDRFGHLAGDDVLRAIAEALKGSLRQGDVVYRYGGEEFVVLLPGQALVSASTAAERLRSAVEGLAIPTFPDGVITISAGVAESAGGTPTSCVGNADAALRRAKERGRNRVEVADA